MRIPLLVAALLLAGPAAAFPNEPNGFRDIDWGAPFDRNQREMTPVRDGVDAEFYVRRDSELALGPAKLQSLSYAYRKNRFVGVVFRTKGKDNERLVEELTSQYGPPKRSGDPSAQLLQWIGKTARIEVFCQYDLLCMGSLASMAAYREVEREGATQTAPPPRRAR